MGNKDQKYKSQIRIRMRINKNGMKLIQQNKLKIGMQLSRSRLPSIAQQPSEQEGAHRTQLSLLNVYYQLYAINYVPVNMEPKDVFKNMSRNIQQKLPSLVDQHRAFKQDPYQQEVSMIYSNYIKQNISKSSQKNNMKVYLTKEELQQKLKHIIPQSANSSLVKHQQQVSQTLLQSKQTLKYNTQLDQTAQSRITVTDILEKLQDLDEERTDIKYQIYAEDGSKMDGLYHRWAVLHQKMKQILQVYLNRIGNGKSLIELYNQIDSMKNSEKVIEGYAQKQLLVKLDIYLQSLFSDERQILLYRNRNHPQKSRISKSNSSTHNNTKNVRKKLTYC